ncbi:MAG: DsbA family protein [Methylobacter sp.]|jgi:putative protein-disulfide isomerase
MIATLFYIHDPMCSWCYDFEASFCALQKALPTSVRVIKLVGGLAPDTTETMPDDLQKSIQQTWHRIEQTVPNIQFNYDFWTINTPVRSTYPACRAILAAKKQGADFEAKMISAIQTAYYRKAKNPSLQSTLLECAAETGLDVSEFANDLAGNEVENCLQNEISMARRLGATSFPSLRLEHNGRISPITVGYLGHGTMLNKISGTLKCKRPSMSWHI